jgi:hypothetical protein
MYLVLGAPGKANLRCWYILFEYVCNGTHTYFIHDPILKLRLWQEHAVKDGTFNERHIKEVQHCQASGD